MVLVQNVHSQHMFTLQQLALKNEVYMSNFFIYKHFNYIDNVLFDFYYDISDIKIAILFNNIIINIYYRKYSLTSYNRGDIGYLNTVLLMHFMIFNYITSFPLKECKNK